MKQINTIHVTKLQIVREYDQEILQSQTADNTISNHETLGRQTKQSNQLFLPYQDNCKTSNVKLYIEQLQTIHHGSNNKHQVNNNRTGGGG